MQTCSCAVSLSAMRWMLLLERHTLALRGQAAVCIRLITVQRFANGLTTFLFIVHMWKSFDHEVIVAKKKTFSNGQKSAVLIYDDFVKLLRLAVDEHFSLCPLARKTIPDFLVGSNSLIGSKGQKPTRLQTAVYDRERRENNQPMRANFRVQDSHPHSSRD